VSAMTVNCPKCGTSGSRLSVRPLRSHGIARAYKAMAWWCGSCKGLILIDRPQTLTNLPLPDGIEWGPVYVRGKNGWLPWGSRNRDGQIVPSP
jgi:hypothetical protein